MSVQSAGVYAITSAVGDVMRERMRAVAEWKGGWVLKGVRNALIGTGCIGVAVSIYEFSAPLAQVTMPSWMIGTVVVGVSAVGLVGGVCLYAFSPPKIQKLVKDLEKATDHLAKENQKLKDHVSAFQEGVETFEKASQKTQKNYQILEGKLETTGDRMKNAVVGLKAVEVKMQAAALTSQDTEVRFQQQVDRLATLLTASPQEQTTENKTPAQTDQTVADYYAFLEDS